MGATASETADDADTLCIVDFGTGRVTLPDTPYAPHNAPEPPACDATTPESESPSSPSSPLSPLPDAA